MEGNFDSRGSGFLWEDFKRVLEAQGCLRFLTCGTCLNYYGLTDKLEVGSVTNMYTIVEKMAEAGKIIQP